MSECSHFYASIASKISFALDAKDILEAMEA